MSTPRPRTHPRARLGLLVTTLVTAGALLASGVAGWAGAREVASMVTRGRAQDLLRAARTAVRQARDAPGEPLQALFDEWGGEGLRYVAVVDGRGRVRGEAGVPSTPLDGLVVIPPRLVDGEPRAAGDRVRVIEPLRPPRPRRPGPPALLVVEFEPVVARAVISRARTTLALNGAASAALVLLAGVFWRLSVRAEEAEAELARDRHLAALGEMSAVLGHELRNPLASLKGHAQLLVEKLPEEGPARAKAERVVAEAVRLERLTGEVLDFARSGEVQREDADPAALLRRAAEVAGEGRVDVDVAGAPAAWSLDPGRLEQVLVNLLRNAVQASPDGARVEAIARVEAASGRSGGRLVFTVRDRGEGLPEAEVERLFEPFHTRRVRGTGLGLAVARRIVEAHGGTLRAANHAGGGAELTVELPAA